MTEERKKLWTPTGHVTGNRGNNLTITSGTAYTTGFTSATGSSTNVTFYSPGSTRPES
jgi:hypothetical protein